MWTEEDVACFYNFNEVIGDAHINFLITFAPFVDFDEMRLRPTDYV